MLHRRSICVAMTGFMTLLAQPVNRVAHAAWQPQTSPSGQAAATSAAGQSPAGTTTTYEPRDQVVQETVYDTECYQVPVTQMQTRYRTEYQTQTVPVIAMGDRPGARDGRAGPAPDGDPAHDGRADPDDHRAGARDRAADR